MTVVLTSLSGTTWVYQSRAAFLPCLANILYGSLPPYKSVDNTHSDWQGSGSLPPDLAIGCYVFQ